MNTCIFIEDFLGKLIARSSSINSIAITLNNYTEGTYILFTSKEHLNDLSGDYVGIAWKGNGAIRIYYLSINLSLLEYNKNIPKIPSEWHTIGRPIELKCHLSDGQKSMGHFNINTLYPFCEYLNRFYSKIKNQKITKEWKDSTANYISYAYMGMMLKNSVLIDPNDSLVDTGYYLKMKYKIHIHSYDEINDELLRKNPNENIFCNNLKLKSILMVIYSDITNSLEHYEIQYNHIDDILLISNDHDKYIFKNINDLIGDISKRNMRLKPSKIDVFQKYCQN